jgi:hypothetical protein
MRSFTRAGAVALALGLIAAPASAQLFNNPVYFSPSGGTGFSLNGDYARGFGDNESLNFAGGRGVLGLGPVTIMGGGGVAFDGGSEFTFGSAISLNILDLPLVPVAINAQAGIGVIDLGGITELDIPIGAGLAIKVPSPLLDVESWVAPRIHITRLDFDAGLPIPGAPDTRTEVGYGVSAGLNVTLPTGLGFHAAVDYVSISSFDLDAFVVGAGIHYRIRVPGLVPGGIVR